ncbi:MAG: MBL fold metallo-hydrolase [Bacillota bacterium]
MLQVLQDVYTVSDARETVNSVFITTEKGTIVVDTMRGPADGELLQAHISAQTAKPIYLTINSHHHPDHTFGNTAFSAPLISTETTRTLMRDRLSSIWAEVAGESTPLPLPNLTFEGEMSIHLADKTVRLIELGGHAPGTCVVYLPERRVLFTSDLVFVGRFPFMGDADLDAWIAALQYMEGMDVEHVLPGHGKPSGPEAITEQREWLESFTGRARQLMREHGEVEATLDKLIHEFDIPDFRHQMLREILPALVDSAS